MGFAFLDKIKQKLKGNKAAVDGLEKGKDAAAKAIDEGAAKAGIIASKTDAAKTAVNSGIDKVKAELA